MENKRTELEIKIFDMWREGKQVKEMVPELGIGVKEATLLLGRSTRKLVRELHDEKGMTFKEIGQTIHPEIKIAESTVRSWYVGSKKED